MKRLLVFGCCVMIISGLLGCDGAKKQPAVNNLHQPDSSPDASFPEFLVGTWKGDNLGWEFNFADDGTIAWAVIELAQVKIRPNQTTQVSGRLGEPGIFEAGDCDVEYDAPARTLSATIRMKHIYMDMAENVLKGTSEYFFSGEVAPDGKTWHTEKLVTLDLGAYRKDPNSPPDNPRLTKWTDFKNDPNEGGEPMIFTKVEDNPAEITK